MVTLDLVLQVLPEQQVNKIQCLLLILFFFFLICSNLAQKDLTLNSAVPETQFLSCAKYMCLPSCWDYNSFLI